MGKNFITKISTRSLIVIYTIILLGLIILTKISFAQSNLSYPIVDTDQELFYDTIVEINEPAVGDDFYGQDANYTVYVPNYQDNGDGTITDLITGLMWSKSPDMDGDGDIDYDDKMSYDEAIEGAESFNLAGYTDWRVPTIKESYSLILFSGLDPSGYEGTSTDDLIPFINTDFFDFAYGDLSADERLIDAQYVSSTMYVGTTMMGDETMFGVNFADGRIKGYGIDPLPGQTEDKQFYVMYVRGEEYGINDYEENGDGTITDNATGLMWVQDDDGEGMNWEDALNYAENYEFAGYSDWRLPNAKELQSILDYSRAPSVTNSPAIDPIFNCSQITDEGGNINYPFYWTGTTHASWLENAPGGFGAYVCFGEALGWMEIPPNSGNYTLLDVHGAGAQRSDPKTGNPDNYPYGHGPQGDVIRIFNHVRLVRDADSSLGYNELRIENNWLNVYPNPASNSITIDISIENTENTTIQIINLFGEIVYLNTSVYTDHLNVEIENFDAGLYFVRAENNDSIITKKFTKK